MSSIPSHYSERYVNQRYNKALHIVQHLPASSSFQPNKDEKLQLYSLYKQVSHGDIDTQRPGIFDVVGRAKWDAWKKLKGLSSLEAKHRYVDTLLKICAEAYKKPAAKVQVQQIIQAFATIRPMDDDDSDDTEESDDSNDEEGHDDGETSESVDEEEQAYLMDIQQSVPAMTPSKSASTMGSQASDSYHSLRSPVLRSSTSTRTKQSNRLSWHGKQPRQLRRAPSIDSTQSMVTAPNAPTRRLSRSSSITTTNFNNAAGMRPPSTMSQRSDVNQQSQYYSRTRRTNLPHAGLAAQESTALGGHTSTNIREPLFDEDHLDNSVNPWATTQGTGGGSNVIPNRRYRMGDDSSDDSIDEEYKQNYLYAPPLAHNLTSAPPSSGTGPSTTTGGMMTGIASSSSVASHYYQQTNRPQQHPHQQQHQQQQQQMNQFDLPMQSPLLGGSTTSSVTATGAFSDSQRQNQHHRQQQPLHSRENRLSTDQQYTSVVALGPATKRALEILQAEILALNERIDGLRQELIDRDQKDLQHKKKKSILSGRTLSQRGDDDEIWDAWGWVFKAALKHTTVNLITIFVIVLLLYKRGNPIADVIIGSLYKQWHKFKLSLAKNNRIV